MPVLRLTATVSSVVLTWNVERTTRPSSHSRRGRSRTIDRLPRACRFAKMDIEHSS